MSSTKPKLRLAGALAVLATLGLAISCRGFFVNATVTSITIGPTGVTLSPGQTLQMVASGALSDNSTPRNVTSQCFWSSTNGSAGTIDQNSGLLTAAATVPNPPQTTTITASYQALTPATAKVSVCPAETDLTIGASPTTVVAATATPIQFTAVATFTGGVSNQNVIGEVTWNISNTDLLSSIDSTGLGTTSGDSTPESSTITASLCGVTSGNSVIIKAQ
jgi:hypothetical protein